MGHSLGAVRRLPDGVKREDWRVGNPVGAGLEETRRVLEDIERRVHALLVELNVLPATEETAEPGDGVSDADGGES